jgi:hypothetical protein
MLEINVSAPISFGKGHPKCIAMAELSFAMTAFGVLS